MTKKQENKLSSLKRLNYGKTKIKEKSSEAGNKRRAQRGQASPQGIDFQDKHKAS